MYMAPSEPNSSIPIKKQAIGVLVAPQKTAIKPRAAKKGPYTCNIPAKTFPSVAPIVNNGVTSPP